MSNTENVVSLATAKKLEEAGVECCYQDGSLVYRRYRHGHKLHLIADWTEDGPWDDDLPVPRLEELLIGIDQENWQYAIYNEFDFETKKLDYKIKLAKRGPEKYNPILRDTENTFLHESLIEAVAASLIWVKTH